MEKKNSLPRTSNFCILNTVIFFQSGHFSINFGISTKLNVKILKFVKLKNAAFFRDLGVAIFSSLTFDVTNFFSDSKRFSSYNSGDFLISKFGFPPVHLYPSISQTQTVNPRVASISQLAPPILKNLRGKLKGAATSSPSHSRFPGDLTSSVIDLRRAEFAPSGNTCGGCTRAWAAILHRGEGGACRFIFFLQLPSASCSHRRGGGRYDSRSIKATAEAEHELTITDDGDGKRKRISRKIHVYGVTRKPRVKL